MEASPKSTSPTKYKNQFTNANIYLKIHNSIKIPHLFLIKFKQYNKSTKTMTIPLLSIVTYMKHLKYKNTKPIDEDEILELLQIWFNPYYFSIVYNIFSNSSKFKRGDNYNATEVVKANHKMYKSYNKTLHKIAKFLYSNYPNRSFKKLYQEQL